MRLPERIPVTFILDDNLARWRELFIRSCPPPVNHAPGTRLSESGSSEGKIYFILSGLVKVYTSNMNGYTRLLGYHKANSLCVLDGLRGGEPSVVTVETVAPTAALELTPELLREMCRQNARLATDLLLYVGDVLRLMCFDAERQSVSDVTTRLAVFLCLYLESAGEGTETCVPLSQESLASAINASRIHTARVCERLKREGVIEIGRKRVTVKDLRALRDLAGV